LAPIQLAGINEFALYFSIAVTQLITQVLVTIPCAVLFLHGNSVAHLSRFLIGIVTLATISIMLAITLCVFTHHFQSFRLSTTVTGILLLLSGSLYPTAALPNWIQPLSYLTPLSYSLDLVRNGATGFSPTMLAIFPEIALGIAATVVTTALTLLSTQRNRHYCPRKLRIPKNRGS
jgi:ABC-type polysaccharide/polyol phosphate export permease